MADTLRVSTDSSLSKWMGKHPPAPGHTIVGSVWLSAGNQIFHGSQQNGKPFLHW